MSNSERLSVPQQQKFTSLFQRLATDEVGVIINVCRELAMRHVEIRGTLAPRGELLRAAKPITTEENLDLLVPHCSNLDPEVSLWASIAVSLWGGDREVSHFIGLTPIVPYDSEIKIQRGQIDYVSYFHVLGNIGGATAAQTLTSHLASTDYVLACTAINTIHRLISGGSRGEDSDGPVHENIRSTGNPEKDQILRDMKNQIDVAIESLRQRTEGRARSNYERTYGFPRRLDMDLRDLNKRIIIKR